MSCMIKGLLAKGHELKIISVYTHKHPFNKEDIPEEILKSTKMEGIFIDTRVNPVEAFSSMITSDSYNISRFFSADFDIRLSKLLKKEKYDIIQMESLFMTPYLGTIRRFSKAKLVLRSHNIEYRVWKDLAKGTRNIAKKAYLKYLASQLETYERDILKQVDGIAAISDSDFQNFKKLGFKRELVNIPFGLDVDQCSKPENRKESICYLGSLDWRPNQEGLIWFLDEIWPVIHTAYPKLEFHVAGRNMPDFISQMKMSGVHYHGEVENAREFLRQHSMLVVPLLTSGGIRVRVLEAMATGSCVIATTRAAEGMKVTDNKQIMLANNAREFVQAITLLMDTPGLQEGIGERAYKFVKENYDNDEITNELELFYLKLKKDQG